MMQGIGTLVVPVDLKKVLGLGILTLALYVVGYTLTVAITLD
jgi:hypothetical protein